MDHKQALELLPAYIDQELAMADALAVERHIGDCHECQQEYAAQNSVSQMLKKNAVYFNAPAHLVRRIEAALPQNKPGNRLHAWRFKVWNFNWLNAGALAMTLLALVWSGNLYLSLPSANGQLTEELVSSHIRSLQVDHLSDVVSTDRHTVKPWFNGKLNFSPPVIDLASQGFPLVGGRLDYLHGRNVAVLIYRRNQHPVNLYIWPNTESDTAFHAQSLQGYHLVQWMEGGMNYWVVSDLAMGELQSFSASLRLQVSKG